MVQVTGYDPFFFLLFGPGGDFRLPIADWSLTSETRDPNQTLTNQNYKNPSKPTNRQSAIGNWQSKDWRTDFGSNH
jgi:hypothetical protein